MEKTELIKTLPGSILSPILTLLLGERRSGGLFQISHGGREREESISNHPGEKGGWEDTDRACFKHFIRLTLTVLTKK